MCLVTIHPQFGHILLLRPVGMVKTRGLYCGTSKRDERFSLSVGKRASVIVEVSP